MKCESGQKCSSCEDGFGVDRDNRCSKCSEIVHGCELCQNYTKCEECVAEYYYPYQGKCLACDEVYDHCLKCS